MNLRSCTQGQKLRGLKRISRKLKPFWKARMPCFFSYPVYTFLAPSQLYSFIRCMKTNGVNVQGKYATQISTSKHFYDMTAHKYVEENLLDMGVRYVRAFQQIWKTCFASKDKRSHNNSFFRFYNRFQIILLIIK